MYHRTYKITPSQQAANGALDMFIEGHRTHRTKQQLVGLSVLSSATEAQVHEAMVFVCGTQGLSLREVEAILKN